MGAEILSTVKYAAILAVYEANRNRAKSHHTAETILPDNDLKII